MIEEQNTMHNRANRLFTIHHQTQRNDPFVAMYQQGVASGGPLCGLYSGGAYMYVDAFLRFWGSAAYTPGGLYTGRHIFRKLQYMYTGVEINTSPLVQG